MSKKRRFYQYDGEDWFIEDMGNTLAISGFLLEGMNGKQLLVVSPAGTMPPFSEQWGNLMKNSNSPKVVVMDVIQPSLEEWSALIRQTDNPVYFADDETGMAKVLHRKQRMAISGAIQQQIWMRDDYRCLFTGKRMGEVPITIDHWMPLELGGQNIETNYISMSRKTNKDKGNQHPEEWCKANGYSYTEIMGYLNGSITIRDLSHLKEKLD